MVARGESTRAEAVDEVVSEKEEMEAALEKGKDLVSAWLVWDDEDGLFPGTVVSVGDPSSGRRAMPFLEKRMMVICRWVIHLQLGGRRGAS